eukprot:TRINITY_DN20585_c0_g1_i1.p1 TRINITY_DN20585_c0_g1~~TRINITY_DN20585_c0_g1_i1.p1  ORF type:complete len:223 (-),score=44.66 TRINITY_DN20585_c0_g1_i1:98-766(-)
MRWISSVILSASSLGVSPLQSWDWNWDARQKEPRSKGNRYLLLVRHGQYDFGTGRLTPKGWEQAFATGERLKALDLSFESIRRSSMPRAIETASAIETALPSVPRMPTNDLLCEGKPYPDTPPRTSWRAPHILHEQGARIEAAFRELFHRSAVDKDSYEIIVCHANVIRYFVCRALQIPPEAWLRLSLKHASITLICIRPDGRVSLRALGDSGHLPPSLLTV